MKTKRPFFLSLTLLFIFVFYSKAYSNDLSDAEKAYILSKFCTEVKYNFVFYNDLTFNWDSICIAALPGLLETKTYDEYVNGLKMLCSRLNDGHTNIHTGNNDSNKDNWIRPLPIKTKRIGNQVYITEVLSNDFMRQGMRAGSEILRIDGMDVIEYVNRYKRPYIGSSTPQWTEYAPYIEFELTKERGSVITEIMFKNPDGKSHTIRSNRNIEWDAGANPIFEFKIIEGNTGLLKVTTFMGDNFIKEFDKLYPEIEKTDALIIDLRDNGGGNSYYADYIIRHLSETPVRVGKWSSRMYIAAHGSWGYPQEWYMTTPHALQPVKDKTLYTKPLALLVNATIFSSAENFCVTFRGLNKGKIIGMPTGGSTGNPINIHLGSDIYATICTKNEWDVEGNTFIGIGIIPDIIVEETNEVFLTGRDMVVEEALRQIWLK